MRCPTCGFENLLGLGRLRQLRLGPGRSRRARAGVASAAACLASTSTRWGTAPAEILDRAPDVDDAIQRMHDKGIDCVLVAEAIGSSGSSPIATRS